MEALRRSARERKEEAKNAMYDESGQLNAWNSKEDQGDTAHMDLSTVGSIKKKDAELNAIRAMAHQRRGVKDRIYDSSGRLNAWTSLKDIEKDSEEIDLSAEGMNMKKVRTSLTMNYNLSSGVCSCLVCDSVFLSNRMQKADLNPLRNNLLSTNPKLPVTDTVATGPRNRILTFIHEWQAG